MNKYQAKYSGHFKKDFKALKKKPEIIQRLESKIMEILENPYHYKPLRNVLKNRRRAHIGGFVLIFEVVENEKAVYFHSFQHHDEVYKN